MTTNGSITRTDASGKNNPLNWTDGLPPSPLRDGLQLVFDFWQGNWSQAVAEAPLSDHSSATVLKTGFDEASCGDGGLRVYAGGQRHLVASVGYQNSWAFKVLLVFVVDPRVYRGALDDAISHAASQTLRAEAQVARDIASTQSDVRDQARTHMVAMAIVMAAVLAAGAWFISLLSSKISTMLHSISSRVHCAAMLDFAHGVGPITGTQTFSEIVAMRESFVQMAANLQAFSTYVPHTVVRMVHFGKGVARLGVEERDATVMFSSVVSRPSHPAKRCLH
mmetsp:Transcript_71719/g.191344  ORF Transcript_71719/g.191344 Transcript_71719/m.191344 type:complete len:279 (+) Transcript_71719:1206-2042(+)